MSEIIKTRERLKNDAGTYDVVYKETLAELVKAGDDTTVQGHLDNSVVHITAEEREGWNGKLDKADGTLAFVLGRDASGIYVEY